MSSLLRFLCRSLLALMALAAFVPAHADEAAIRKAIGERFTDFPKIDEVTKSPIPGLYEVRNGTDVVYTDEQGNYVIQGEIIGGGSTITLASGTVDPGSKLTNTATVSANFMASKSSTATINIVMSDA